MSTRTAYPNAYGAEYQARRAQDVADREAQEEERRRANEAARQRILDGVAAERAADAKKQEAAIEAALAPAKEREKRAWLAAHPDKTEHTFETKAWPLLRANLLDEDRRRGQEAAVERLRATGQYGRL
jgi:hypothetical protein